jgi:hypothetical protein|tara:strand:+ start:99 stop:326 length:228 start_codon:yes stop_codon:yes gene_type:complete
MQVLNTGKMLQYSAHPGYRQRINFRVFLRVHHSLYGIIGFRGYYIAQKIPSLAGERRINFQLQRQRRYAEGRRIP